MKHAAPEPAISRGRRAYALGLLTLVYTWNFVDRSLLGNLAQPIKADLRLHDWQLGVLGGLAFALLYSIGGLPAAWLAERRSRVGLISIAVALWSVMTGLCGLATGFWTLALARVGVGVGEAGYNPPAYSLIADYYPPERRASATGLFTLGVPLGVLLAALLGGPIAEAWGWRAAFLALGLPGLLLALLFRLTMPEPVRGGMDAAVPADEPPPFKEVLRRVAGKPAFVHLTLGAALASFAGYAFTTFGVSFLLRGFPLDLTAATRAYGLFGALSVAVGVAAGGFLSDAAGRRDPRLRAVVPGLGLILAGPLYMLAFNQSSVGMLGLLVIPPAILQYLYLGPVFALAQNMVGARMRATTTAIVVVVVTLIGLGLGPLAIGALSDLFAARSFAGAGAFAQACPGGQPPAEAAADLASACRAASFSGLRQALMAAAAILAWSGLHLVLAGRTLERDLDT